MRCSPPSAGCRRPPRVGCFGFHMLSFPYHMSYRTTVPEGGPERLPSRRIRQGVSMSSSNTPQDVRYVQSGRRPRQAGRVDFTFMYAAHDAFTRDLRRLADAVEPWRTPEDAWTAAPG